MTERTDWATHLQRTKGHPPSELLVKALAFVEHRRRALDIGGGALRDSRYLLQQGFEVTDLDSEAPPTDIVVSLDPKKFQYAASTFEDFVFPKAAYDLANATFSLPFNPPESFERVFQSMKDSLVSGGIFCGQLFGDRDEWTTRSHMTFHTIEQAKKLIEDMETLFFEERQWSGRLASGIPKQWHVFNVIARKI